MIAWNDLQLLAEVKLKKKKKKKKMRGPNQGTDKPKSDPKLGFSLFSQVQFITFPLNCIGSLLGTSLTSRGKTHTQKLLGGGGGKFGPKRSKLGPKLGVLLFTHVWFISILVTLFRVGAKKPPHQFFPCKFCKHWKQPQKLSDFQF